MLCLFIERIRRVQCFKFFQQRSVTLADMGVHILLTQLPQKIERRNKK